MSAVQVVKESLPSFIAGNGTVGASPAPLTAVAFEVLKHVVVRATAGNSGTIEVSSTLGGDGFLIAEGEQTPPIYVDSTGKVFLLGSGAGQDYSFVAN